LFTYLTGEPLYKVDPSIDLVAELGRSLAVLGKALHDFTHPAASRELLWDLQQASGLERFVPYIEGAELRAAAVLALDRYVNVLAPQQRNLRAQVLHNDFNPHNILIDTSGAGRVSGILDFGDTVRTPLINDLAVAVSYQVEGPNWLGRAVAFVSAYHAVRPLLWDEVDQLFDLIRLRHVMTIAITSWRATLYPDNSAYILRNRPRAILALDVLAHLGRDAGARHFLNACGMA
jgi:Ser/Thr protein kinase RdoA (MazF antagonist)